MFSSGYFWHFLLIFFGITFQTNVVSCITLITFGFTIDTTGSMGSEIQQVRTGLKAIVDLTPSAVSNYAVVGYNDPTVGPTLLTSDPAKVKDFLDTKLSPSGGDDCPELAMRGLKTTIQLSLSYSVIFFVSDAAAKDYTEWTTVRDMANRKNITIYFLLTGCCSNCNNENHKVYTNLATSTNGKVYQISKSGITTVMNYAYVNAARDALKLRFPPATFTAMVNYVTQSQLPQSITDLLSDGNKKLLCETHYPEVRTFFRSTTTTRLGRRQFILKIFNALIKAAYILYSSLQKLISEYITYSNKQTVSALRSTESSSRASSSLAVTSFCIFFVYEASDFRFLICFKQGYLKKATITNVYDGQEAAITDFKTFKVVRSAILNIICNVQSSGSSHKVSIFLIFSTAIIWRVIMAYL